MLGIGARGQGLEVLGIGARGQGLGLVRSHILFLGIKYAVWLFGVQGSLRLGRRGLLFRALGVFRTRGEG